MPRKKTAKNNAYQMVEGVWYALRNPDLSECCDCGLVHHTEFKIDGINIFWRSKIDRRKTRLARKLHGITVTKNAPPKD